MRFMLLTDFKCTLLIVNLFAKSELFTQINIQSGFPKVSVGNQVFNIQ